MVKILDCTLRDGGYNTNWNFDNAFIDEFIKCINLWGIDYFECGYRNFLETENKGKFYRCTKDICKKLKCNAKIGVMADIKRMNLNDFLDAKKDFIDFVRLAVHPDEIQKSLEVSQILKSRGYNLFLQLMDATNIKTEDFEILCRWKYKDILESVYFADTYGIFEQDDVQNIFATLQAIGFNNISFHAHNKNGKALENTLKAIDCGVYSVDISLKGLGRNGGNLDAVVFLNSMNKYSEHYATLETLL